MTGRVASLAPAAHRPAPKIKKIEPVVRVAAAVALEYRGIAFDRSAHREIAAADAHRGKVRDPFEYHMVVILAAVQADHEEYGATQDGGRAHGPGGHVRFTSEECDRLCGLFSQGAIGEHADISALIEPLGDVKHGVDLTQGNNVRNPIGIDGGEDTANFVRGLFNHSQGDAQSRLLS